MGAASEKRIALLRGINVGRAKAVPMPELVAVFEGLGCVDVSTVLRSGNVVFRGEVTGARIAAAVLAATGVHSDVLVLAASEFRRIAADNPLTGIATDGSRCFVTFLSETAEGIEAPDAASLDPERLVVAPRAVYQWMPNGSQQTSVPKAFWRQFTGHVTARNLNTVQRLLVSLED